MKRLLRFMLVMIVLAVVLSALEVAHEFLTEPAADGSPSQAVTSRQPPETHNAD